MIIQYNIPWYIIYAKDWIFYEPIEQIYILELLIANSKISVAPVFSN